MMTVGVRIRALQHGRVAIGRLFTRSFRTRVRARPMKRKQAALPPCFRGAAPRHKGHARPTLNGRRAADDETRPEPGRQDLQRMERKVVVRPPGLEPGTL